MVMPTPFERLLQETVQLANRDAAAAYARLDELFGKSLTEQDVLQLGAFSVHLGASALGRFDETAAFQRRLLSHPGLKADSHVARSLWRGLAVVLSCAGKEAEAAEAAKRGVTGPSDTCRLAVMTAQTLAVRARVAEALPHLRRATELCRGLDSNDEVVAQVAAVSGNLLRLAEPQARLAHELLIAAVDANSAALFHAQDWRIRHRMRFQHGQALLLAGKPIQALGLVQEMMEQEDLHDAGPGERFWTVSLACRAQAMRGQPKVAAGALEACQDFARRIEDPVAAKAAQEALTDIEAYVADAGRT
jgi:hypothetical protein